MSFVGILARETRRGSAGFKGLSPARWTLPGP